MAKEAQFSLSWGAYKNNICEGLSSLQQNGEFVDMTLAADGHYVKVHQMIVALASPYIKELITSAHNTHPIIILNKISYFTLSAILEYIYTGEVLVPIEKLSELFEAGKELHIKGLEDMNLDLTLPTSVKKSQLTHHQQSSNQYEKRPSTPKEVHISSVPVEMDDNEYYEIIDSKEGLKYTLENVTEYDDQGNMMQHTEIQEEHIEEETLEEQTLDESMQTQETITDEVELNEADLNQIPALYKEAQSKYGTKKILQDGSGHGGSDMNVMQYTVSNQGSLQLVLNRFVYYLKHTRRDGARQWRCVDYLSRCRCPAAVVTRDDLVVQRIKAHTHIFHDKRILKKVRSNAIYSAITEAIKQGESIKTESEQNSKKDKTNDQKKIVVQSDENLVF